MVDLDRKCFSLRTECYKLHERVDGKFLGGVGVLEATNEKEDVKRLACCLRSNQRGCEVN